jgi:hypothetical protein
LTAVSFCFFQPRAEGLVVGTAHRELHFLAGPAAPYATRILLPGPSNGATHSAATSADRVVLAEVSRLACGSAPAHIHERQYCSKNHGDKVGENSSHHSPRCPPIVASKTHLDLRHVKFVWVFKQED